MSNTGGGSGARRGVKAWRRWMPWLLFALGAASVLLSLIPEPGFDSAWVRDVFLGLGGSVLLFVPFYLLTREIDSHFMQVTEEQREEARKEHKATREQVSAVKTAATETAEKQTERIKELGQKVERLEDVSQRVNAALEADVAADRASFAAIRSVPTRAALVDALSRALTLNLVSHGRSPRVRVTDSTDLFVAFRLYAEDSKQLLLGVESLDGQIHEWRGWPEDKEATEVLIEIGQVVRKHTNETFKPERLFEGLANLLEAAEVDPARRPAVQLCGPQWLVCEGWIARCDGPGMYRPQQLRQDQHLQASVAAKQGVDADRWDEAVMTLLALFPYPSPWDARY